MPMPDRSRTGDKGVPATRAFIAIELPAEVKRQIAGHIEQLKGIVPEGVRWGDPRITHLTLVFLGNVPDVSIPLFVRLTDSVTSASPPFSLRTGSLGAFPNRRRPRVLWLGLEGDIQPLYEIHGRLQDELEAKGFSIEKRPFKPHVTLGRARAKGLVPLEEEDLNLLPYERLEFEVRELVIMSSVLTPRGPIHTPLHVSPLSGTANTCARGLP